MRAALLIPAVLLALAAPQVTMPQAAPPTFHADTQVVLLDLVAKDGKGRAVADLELDDLQVFEDGRRCQVASFRLVRAPGRAATTAVVPSAPMAAAPAEEGPATPSQANLVVLLFDHLPISMAPYARQGALDLLKQRFPPNTWFAVFKVDRDGTRVLQPFTADPARLTAAVQAATVGDDARNHAAPAPAPDLQAIAPPTPPPPGEAQRPPDVAPVPQDLATAIGQGAAAELAELSQRVQTYDSLYALMVISRSLAPVRGRKSVIYFGEDREVPDLRHATYDDMVSVANRANVTIHTVDARGLTAARVGGRGGFDEALGLYSASGPTGGGRGSIGNGSWAAGTETDENTLRLARTVLHIGSFLGHVAGDTGGLAIAHTNDLGAGLAGVVEELGQYYELVYTPPNPAYDGRFRRIQVKVSRPGVRVRTRSGYYATPATTPSLAAFELPLMTALAQADPPRAFEHEAGLLQFAPRGAEREAVFLARVPVAGVQIARDPAAGTYHAQLTLLALIKDSTGRAVARLSQDWPVDGKLDATGRPREANCVFRRLLPLPPGRYTIEAALQDRQTGGISTSRTTASVEAPAGSLALGSLTVVRAAQAADPAAGLDPLTLDGVAVQPELGSPVLRPGTREVPLLLPVYAPAGAAPELHLELRRGSEILKTLTPALPAPDAEGRLTWIGGMSAGSLPAGRYQVVATVRAGADAAESRTSFEIRPQGELARATGQPAPRAPLTNAPPVPAELVPVLERAGRHVLEYERSFSDLVVEETYKQIVSPRVKLDLTVMVPGRTQTTKAELVFVRLAGEFPWASYRDVFEVDGHRLREQDQRLVKLLSDPQPDAHEQANSLLAASAAYNIGPVTRTVNLPTLPLVFLLPDNQPRFEFRLGERKTIAATEAVELLFRETSRPTLVKGPGGADLPARGRFWVSPTRGTVVQSEVEFDFGPEAEARVTTDYRSEPTLAMWVPSEMREEYADVKGAKVRTFFTAFKGVARYGKFRRFSVTSQETVAVPPAPQ